MRYYLLIYLVMALALLIVWFRGANILYFWDDTWFFNPFKRLEFALHSWVTNNLGAFAPESVFLPVLIFWFIPLSLFGIPLWLQQQLFYFVGLFIMFAGFHYFTKIYSRFFGVRLSDTVIFGGSLLYVFNYFSMIYTFNLYKWHIMTVAFLPIAIAIYISEINSTIVKRVLLTALITSLAMLGLIKSWPFIILCLNLFIIYTSLIRSNGQKYRYLSRTLAEVLLFNTSLMMLTTYMWYPSLFLSAQVNVSTHIRRIDIDIYYYNLLENTKYNTILNVIFFRGIPELYVATFYEYLHFLAEHPLLLAITIAWIIAFIPPILNKPANNRDTIPHLITIAFSILFLSITQTPLKDLYSWIYRSWYGFGLFNNPWPNVGFVYVFSLSYMFARGMQLVLDRIKIRRGTVKSIVAVAIICASISHAWPLATGDFIPSIARTYLPQYTIDMVELINSIADEQVTNVLIIPAVPNLARVSYDHGGYIGNYMELQLIDTGVIGSYTDTAIGVNKLIEVVRDLYTKEQLLYWHTPGAFADLDNNLRYIIPVKLFNITGLEPLIIANIKFFTTKERCVNVTFKGLPVGKIDILVHKIQYISMGNSIKTHVTSETVASGYIDNESFSISFKVSEYTLVEPRVYNDSNTSYILIGDCRASYDVFYGYQFFIALRLLNVKYVVIRNDVHTWKENILAYSNIDYKFLIDFFDIAQQYNYTRKIYSETRYTIYEIQDPVGLVYIPNKIICEDLEGEYLFGEYKVPSLVKALSMIPPDSTNLAIIDTSVCKRIAFKQSIYVTSSYDIAKISPTYYEVRVTSTDAPFIMVFSQNYDANWIATNYHGKEYMHVKANGYSNAYIISDSGNILVRLIYRLDESYKRSIWVSLIAYAISAVLILLYHIIKRHPQLLRCYDSMASFP